MGKPIAAWSDARLNDLASALEPVPTRVAALGATVEHLTTELQRVPVQVAVLTASVDRLAEENCALRAELAATQRQLTQIAWGLAAALLGATAALVAALV